MFRSAETEVPGNRFSMSVASGHVSSASPSTRLLCLHDHSHSSQTWRASHLTTSTGNETPPSRSIASAPEALHRDTHIEKCRLAQVAKSQSQQTHPKAMDPLPSLYCPALWRRAVRTTWPHRHPHSHFLLMKRLNLEAEKVRIISSLINPLCNNP
jgi:hypothetical protein